MSKEYGKKFKMIPKNIILLVSGILTNDKGEVLLLQRTKIKGSYRGFWQLPEGKVEFGEHPEAALKREIKEETSLKVKLVTLLFITTCQIKLDNENYHIVRIVYKVLWLGTVRLGDDHSQFSWISRKNFAVLKPKMIGLKEILQKAL